VDVKKDVSSKIRHWCARAERSPAQVRRKLYAWGEREGADDVVAALLEEGYVDPKRFAEAFALDHVRLKGWGPGKVAAALRFEHSMDGHIVDMALGAVAAEDVHEAACRAVRKRKQRHPDEDPAKTIGVLLRKGFMVEVARAAVVADDALPKFGPTC
jgi:SOS response regulatory protein OraA/RecX